MNAIINIPVNRKNLKAPSSALLISRYILRLGQAAQKQQCPCCPNPKMYLEIRRADERLLNFFGCIYFYKLHLHVPYENMF